MKLKIVFFYLAVLYFFNVEAQENVKERKFFNFSLFDEISTNGKNSSQITNNFSLGFLNSARTINGIQIGVFNSTETLNGLQVGAFNCNVFSSRPLSGGRANGIQIGVVNGTRRLNGLQIGILNLVEEENAVQLGFVNAASHGLQIGILNFSDNTVQIGILNKSLGNKYPIGFINLIEDGEANFSISFDEMQNFLATIRSGSKYTYGIVGIGYRLRKPYEYFVLEFGLGFHLNITDKFRIDQELVYSNLSRLDFKSEPDEKKINARTFNRFSYRILPSFKIHERYRIFGGASFNYSYTRHEANLNLFTSHHWWKKNKENSYKQINLGWTVGLQYIF